jgi:hypothetical protein
MPNRGSHLGNPGETLFASAARFTGRALPEIASSVPFSFEDAFDPDAARVWNRFRYYFHQGGDARVAFARLRVEYPLAAIAASVRANTGHPYYGAINAVLASLLDG